MTKRKRIPKATAEVNKLDSYADMAGESVAGNPDRMIEEVDAYRSFMMEWQKDYADEGNPRLAVICGMTADIISLLTLCISMLGATKEHKETRP